MADPFLGEIRMAGFNFNPYGWALCQGQLVPLNQNTALFALLGTQFGGDGVSTFGLPDLRSRTPVGQGQGTGLSNYQMGQKGGSESVTQLTSNLPTHTHLLSLVTNNSTLTATSTAQVVNADATSVAPIAGGCLGIPNDGAGTTYQLYHSGKDNNGNPLPRVDLAPQPVTFTGGVTVTGTAALTGGNIPTSVLSPYIAVNFIIAMQGIFPSRN
ncbi:phage tail protein [Pseudomonas putida]|uniref:Phage tail collar domain-containing protein n=1 Tax=Pseudomonas putida TaxID=303 RepID=A0A177SCW4_PSEPU|nr:tail fiber protein [Pseudomonas putida]OAI86262.1 hypothetical protein AYO28_00810 [Pseudomonas putida]